MTKNKVFPAIIFILVLVAIPLLTAYQLFSPVQALAAELEDHTGTEFNSEQAAENSAFRWVAMAEAYQRNGMLNYASNPDDVMAFRWSAMAETYQRNGMLNYASNPDDVMAFRWIAMAKAYEKHGLLNDQLDPGDVSAFRWLAMAHAYEKMGMLNSK